MVLTTIYTIKNVARGKSSELETLACLNNLVLSIDNSALIAEVLHVGKFDAAAEVEAWVGSSKLENQPAYLVMRAALAIVRFSAKTNKAVVALSRAHQRLMLKRAHQQGIDISID